MNIGYHDNFWGKSPEAMFEMADWETTQIEQIEQDFQAALPQIMAEAKAELDDDELAEFIADRQIARMWFAENPEYYGCHADREAVDLWH